MEKKQYKLPKEFAEKWVAALRSGEYKQGTRNLLQIDDNGVNCYCCIGVTGCIFNIPINKIKGYSMMYVKDVIPELPKAFEWSQINGNNMIRELTYMNDIDHKTFPEIANWIEENCEFI